MKLAEFPPTITVDAEKYDGWVKQGAHPSDSVESLVARAKKTAPPA